MIPGMTPGIQWGVEGKSKLLHANFYVYELFYVRNTQTMDLVI